MRQARSQLGSRLAVASSAKISRPRPPAGRTAGARRRSRRKASTSAERAFAGRRFLCSSLMRRAQPHRGVVEHRAAMRQAGIGAGQQVDADAFLEGRVRPDALDDDDALLQPVEGAGVDDDAALVVADADAVAIGEAEAGQRLGMDQRRRPALAGDAGGRVVEAGVEERARRRRTMRNGRSGSPSSMIATWSGNSGSAAHGRGPIGPPSSPNWRGSGISCRDGRSRRGNARSRTAARNRARCLRRMPPGRAGRWPERLRR